MLFGRLFFRINLYFFFQNKCRSGRRFVGFDLGPNTNCHSESASFFQHPATILFVLKRPSAFNVCCIYSSALRNRFFNEAKRERSGLGTYCLQEHL